MKKEAKRKQRNPLKLYTGKNAAKAPIVTGEELFTGEGGGTLRFKGGKLFISHAGTLTRNWTLEDSAYCLRVRGIHGLPIPQDGLIREEIDSLAVGLIKAIHEGNYMVFNRIADVMRDPEKYLASPSQDSRQCKIADAVSEAARRAEGVPSREQVGEVLAALKDLKTGELLFPTARESDKLQAMLEAVGFGWLPHAKRGEHLRKKQIP